MSDERNSTSVSRERYIAHRLERDAILLADHTASIPNWKSLIANDGGRKLAKSKCANYSLTFLLADLRAQRSSDLL